MKDTKSLLKKIKILPEISLPDEWYSFPNDLSFEQRFKKIAESLAALSFEDIPLSDRISELKKKYCDLNRSFKHITHFNQLVSPDYQVSSYIITIVSCKYEIFTSIKALDVLEFEKAGKELTVEKQKILTKILN